MTLLLSAFRAPSVASQPTIPERFPFSVDSSEVIGQAAGIGGIIDADVTPDGHVVVADFRRKQLVAFDAKRGLLWRAGSEGPGPGEYSVLYRLAVGQSGRVYAYDRGGHTISVHRPNGEFVEERQLGFKFDQVDELLVSEEDDLLVISGVTRFGPKAKKSGVHLFRLDSLTHVRSFGPLPSSADRSVLTYWGAGAISWGSGGSILYTRRLPYEIYAFAPTGQREWVVRPPFSFERGPADAFVIQESPGRRSVSVSEEEVPRPVGAVPLERDLMLAGRNRGSAKTWDLFQDRQWTDSVTVSSDRSSFPAGYHPQTDLLWVKGTHDLKPVLYAVWIQYDEKSMSN